MDIGTHDEVPKDLTPLEEQLLLFKKRDTMLRKAEEEERIKDGNIEGDKWKAGWKESKNMNLSPKSAKRLQKKLDEEMEEEG